MQRYEVIAHNTAVESENRIHADDVARTFGFRGGLVPGVDVYAYLTHPVVEAWGPEWLAGGTADVRFHVPVYDGHLTTIEPTLEADGTATARAVDDTGADCANAAFGRGGSPRSTSADRPFTARPDHRPDASPKAFAAYGEGGDLPTLHLTLDPDAAATFLVDARESLPVYRGDAAPAHPGWILRRANDALAAAVRLGPWIHVGSSVRNLGLVRVGDMVEVRSRLVRWWEAKGHRFVELDVALLVDDQTRVTIDHTAIYQPRPTTP
jgi:acyl dehydratase